MKKIKNKVNKLFKFSLLLCMLFSQLASPVKVLADHVVPSYDLEITLDDKGDEDITNDIFVLKNNGTKALVEDKKYILEVIRSFKYVDGTLNEEENKISYSLVSGNLLDSGIEVLHEIFSYNGISYVDVNVYDVIDEVIDFSTYTEENYRELLSTDKVENIMNTSFEEGISYNTTALVLTAVGDSLVCNGQECDVTLNEENNTVKIVYSIKTGDFNPNKKYYVVLKVNDVVHKIVNADINDTLNTEEIDFSKMLQGEYNITYSVREESGLEVLSGSIKFNYNNSEMNNIDFVRTSGVSLELFYSYTVLTEEEKNELGNDYRYLDSPLAYTFESVTFNPDIFVNYNLFDENNRYHVVTSDKLVGAFYEGFEAYTALDVLDILSNEIPYTDLSIVDKDGNVVSKTSYIENGMKLVVNIFGEELVYDFLVYGDVDGGYVEISDLEALIDKVLDSELSYYDLYNLDFNTDKSVDIKDISILAANIYSGEYNDYSFEVEDIINVILESNKDNMFVGETFEVMLSLNNFENDYINALEGLVNYNSDCLRLDNIEILSDLFVGSSKDNRFIFASTDTYDVNGDDLVKLTFTALKEGTYNISVSDLSLISDGMLVGFDSMGEVEVVVNRILHSDASLKSLTTSSGYFDKTFNSEELEYTLYVDSSVNRLTLNGEVNDEFAYTEDFKEYVLTGDNTLISVNVTAEDGTVRTYKVNVIKVYKSSNNNLRDIVIEGYDIEFNKDVLEYEITVSSDTDSLDISALVEDASAWAKIEGNENFTEGENVVTISVYAQNGDVKTYKLIVNKEKARTVTTPSSDSDDEVNEDGVNTEKVVIIILIILVVIGLLYLIFKKDEEEEIKIEQIKPKKEENKNKK